MRRPSFHYTRAPFAVSGSTVRATRERRSRWEHVRFCPSRAVCAEGARVCRMSDSAGVVGRGSTPWALRGIRGHCPGLYANAPLIPKVPRSPQCPESRRMSDLRRPTGVRGRNVRFAADNPDYRNLPECPKCPSFPKCPGRRRRLLVRTPHTKNSPTPKFQRPRRQQGVQVKRQEHSSLRFTLTSPRFTLTSAQIRTHSSQKRDDYHLCRFLVLEYRRITDTNTDTMILGLSIPIPSNINILTTIILLIFRDLVFVSVVSVRNA